MFLEQKGNNPDLSDNYATLVKPRIESHVLSYTEGCNTYFVDLIEGGNGFFAISVVEPLKKDTVIDLYNSALHYYPAMKGLIFEIGDKSDYPTTIIRELITKDRDLVIKVGEKTHSQQIDQISYMDKDQGLYSIFCSYPYFQSSQEIVDFLKDTDSNR